MKCCEGAGLRERSGKFPCGVCGKGVGTNSIQCTSCMSWIHKKCSGLKDDYRLWWTSIVESVVIVISPHRWRGRRSRLVCAKLECVEQFCYLGDMIGAGGGAEDASRVRTSVRGPSSES